MKKLTVLFFALSIFSCAFIAPHGLGDGYQSLLKRNTRSAKVYHDFETRIIVTATYKNREFFDAYRKEYSSKYKLDSAERDALFKEESARIDKSHEFFVALYSTVGRGKPLTHKNAAWRFYLVDDAGRKQAPSSLKKITGNEIISYFYPYIDYWSDLYIVDFMREGVQAGKKIGLVITGPYGEIQIEWPAEG